MNYLVIKACFWMVWKHRFALGLLFGLVTVFWVGLVFNDTIIEITLTLTASYMAFFVVCVSSLLSFMSLSLHACYHTTLILVNTVGHKLSLFSH